MTGLTAGVNGYIGNGQGGVFYCTYNGMHLPIARNIENFQVEYNGDMNNDSLLDGWSPWNPAWTLAEEGRIQQVRVWLLGRSCRNLTPPHLRPASGRLCTESRRNSGR